MQRSVVHPFTQHSEIAIVLPIIEARQFHEHTGRMLPHLSSQRKEGSQAFPSGLCKRSWKAMLSYPHHPIGECHLENGHHLILSVIEFLHDAFVGLEVF
jgi:hypothetical protein